MEKKIQYEASEEGRSIGTQTATRCNQKGVSHNFKVQTKYNYYYTLTR